MNDVMTIANDAYRDATKRKGVTFFLLFLAIAQVAVFSLYEEISLGIHEKMIKDASLGILYLVGIISAMALAFQVPRELRERTAMTLFAKPMGRESYLAGKVLGTGMLSLRNMFFVALGVLALVKLVQPDLLDQEFVKGYGQAFILIFVASVSLAAISLLMSLFMSEGSVVIGLVVVLVLGNASFGLAQGEGSLSFIGAVLSYILPNLFLLDIKTEAAAGLTTSSSYVFMGLLYGLSYTVMIVSLSMVLFRKRDL
jgi:ABC-type transport system involved in multi-copper enzyme maturation permease subunit